MKPRCTLVQILALAVGLILYPQSVAARPAQQAPPTDISQQCYAVANEGGSADALLSVNIENGVVNFLGEADDATEIESIAFIPNNDPALTVLYAVNEKEFGRLNLANGQFTKISGGIGTGQGSNGKREFSDVDGLTYDIAAGKMYGVHRMGSRLPDLLFEINWQTGKVIKDAFGPGRDYVELGIVEVDGDKLHDVDDIAVEPNTGQLYGVTNNSGRNGVLLRINKSTGTQEEVGPIKVGNDTIDDIEGLAFNNSGVLYGSTGDNGPDQNDRNKLFRIDTTTAEAVEVGRFTGKYKDIEALGCLTGSSKPDVLIEKFTNGESASNNETDKVPSIKPGDKVTWTYVVTNPGDVALKNVTVVDDKLAALTPPVAPAFVGGDTNGDGLLDTDETWTYEATGTAENLNAEGSGSALSEPCGSENTERGNVPLYKNRGKVAGTSPSGTTVESTDDSHYCNPPEPAIDVEKSTNGADADDANGADVPQIRPGDKVTWSYRVTNIGAVPLQDVVLVDDKLAALTPPVAPTLKSGDTNEDGILDLEEVWIYEAIGTAQGLSTETAGTVPGSCGRSSGESGESPLYKNMATVSGKVVGDETSVTDEDPSHYCNPPNPAIDIEKATNGEDADDPTGPQITVGNPVEWTYVVKNTGDTALEQVVVTDDKVDDVTCPKTTLAVDESMTCTATGTATVGQYENTSTVNGYSARAKQWVDDTDPSHYIGVLPAIAIEKVVDISWLYTISNPGFVPLDEVTISGEEMTITCDPAGKDTLAPGESISCTAEGPRASFGNTATVTAVAKFGSIVTTLTREVKATPITGLTLDVQIDEKKASPTNRLHLAEGADATWKFIVTNNGSVALDRISVSTFALDGAAPSAVSCPQKTLAVGESMTCLAGFKTLPGNVDTPVGATAYPVGSDAPIVAEQQIRYVGAEPASVGGRTFVDTIDLNGQREPDEASVVDKDIQIALYRFDSTLVMTSGVSSTGEYLFEGVAPDDYYLVFTRPTGTGTLFNWTEPNLQNDALDSDAVASWSNAPNLARTHFFRLNPGEKALHWDAGFAQSAFQVPRTQWPPDGIPAEGTVVYLITFVNGKAVVVATATVNAKGEADFGDVDPGRYQVTLQPPAGTIYLPLLANQ